MAALRAAIAIAAVTICSAAHAQNVAQWHPLISDASVRFGVPEAWIERVMAVESGGHTQISGRPIRSRAGAIGLMQIMPTTWGDMRQRLGLGTDPDNPRDNIFAGTLYLRLMYDRFGYPGCFAAYNAGPARYADYLAGRTSLPSETRAYLALVAKGALAVQAVAIVRPKDMLFYPLGATSPVKPSQLFVTITGGQARE